jgi:hypothetical protein
MAALRKLSGWRVSRARTRSGDRLAIAADLGNGDSFDRAGLEFSKQTPTRTSGSLRQAYGASVLLAARNPLGQRAMPQGSRPSSMR